jgi:hypothetical protein
MKPPGPTSKQPEPVDEPKGQSGGRGLNEPTDSPSSGTVQTFQALPHDAGTPEERRARIDAALTMLGLPTIAEVNRLEAEAAARAGVQSERAESKRKGRSE